MKITTNWVSYVDRAARTIKASVLKNLGVAVPELTDKSQSNLLIVLVDIFAGVSELLNYNIDVNIRELFLPMAQRFSSVLTLAYAANYNGKARTSAFASMLITALDQDDNPVAVPQDIVIPVGTTFTDREGQEWHTVYEVTFRKDYKTLMVEVKQFSTVLDKNLGVSDGSLNMRYALEDSYAEGSLDVKVGNDYWQRVDDLGFSTPDSEDFQVRMHLDGKIYLEFGDGTTGKVPMIGAPISISYQTTGGPLGNVPPDSIITLDGSLPKPHPIADYSYTNPNSGYGGKAIEGIEDLRKAIPLSLRTLYRAVSTQDYLDITLLAPGVRGANIAFDCGLGVMLFVVAEGGGNPTLAFLSEVKAFVERRSVAGLALQVLPSGETHVKGKMTIKGKYRVSNTTIKAAAEAALLDLYSPYRSQANQDVRQSDIIATVDNLPEVDYLVLDHFSAVPYLRPSNLLIDLPYTIEILPGSTTTFRWKLYFDSVSSKFMLYKEGILVQEVHVGIQYTIEGIISIYIPSIPSNLLNNDYWTFASYAYSKDIVLNDMSIPIIGPGDFEFEIIETNG